MSARRPLFGIAAFVVVAALVADVAAGAAPAGAGSPAVAAVGSPPRVETMVVGRRDELLSGPRARTARAARPRVGQRRCAVASATPLAALLATPLAVKFKDFGSCSARARDAGGLFVTAVGGQRNRGSNGWVYKIGSRAGTAGAADPGGAFGDGRQLRAGQRVLWFWCVLRARGCQRTLEVTAAQQTVRAGQSFGAKVTGYDDSGKGVAVAGARVSFDGAEEVTDGAGRAMLPATRVTANGAAGVRASKAGLVRGFPASVTVTNG